MGLITSEYCRELSGTSVFMLAIIDVFTCVELSVPMGGWNNDYDYR